MDAARDFRKSHPELTIEQSYERVYGSQRGLAKAYNDSLPRGGFIPQRRGCHDQGRSGSPDDREGVAQRDRDERMLMSMHLSGTPMSEHGQQQLTPH